MTTVRRIKFKILLYVLWVGVFLLTACSPSVANRSTPTAVQAVGNRSNPQRESAYPSPGDSMGESYPAPEKKGTQESYAVITPLPIGVLPQAPAEAPQPQAGKAAISGVAYSFTTRIPLAGTQFYLTSGWGSQHQDPPLAFTGPDQSKGDYVGKTDEHGNISVADVPPGDYYLAFWAPLSWSVAVASEQSNQARLIHVDADQKLTLGIIYVSWP